MSHCDKMEEEEEDVHILGFKDTNKCIKTRHILALVGALGFVNVYALRVNLSVALVAMVQKDNSTSINYTSNECPSPNGNSTNDQQGEFPWSDGMQTIILGSFFYGYILTQIPGGWLAEQIGSKKLFGFGVLCTALFTLITPLAARVDTNGYVMIAVRICEGIGEGVTFPAMHALWGKWAPPLERAKLISFTYAGSHLGTVISMPISGLLCDHGFAGGWPSVFYVFGSIGCLWFVLWMFVAHDSPSQHPTISKEEKNYIVQSIGKEKGGPQPRTPWLSILTSLPVWAIVVAHVTNNWGFYTLLTCLPKYMKDILKFDMSQNGLLSAIPYLTLWILISLVGYLADFARYKNVISTNILRKIFTASGLCLPGLFLVLSGYVGCNHVLAVLFLTLSVGSSSLVYGGFIVNHLDLSPQFAGTLMGITNCAATIPGFLGPQVVGILIEKNNTRSQWQIVFYIAAAIYGFGAVFYILFSDSKEQNWSKHAYVSIENDTQSVNSLQTDYDHNVVNKIHEVD